MQVTFAADHQLLLPLNPCPILSKATVWQRREFREDQFLDLVGPCFQLLAAFMQNAVDFDSQLQVNVL